MKFAIGDGLNEFGAMGFKKAGLLVGLEDAVFVCVNMIFEMVFRVSIFFFILFASF